MIEAKIVADSLNELGNRITTMVVTFPRYILAELNTHRMFSRNSASSRAIPFAKMVEMVKTNPFIPVAWQIDHKGMQGTEYLTAPIDVAMAHDLWLEGVKYAIKTAENLNGPVHVTKQICNRLLEPFMWHTVLITATEWENFFALRCPQYFYEPENLYFRSKKDWQKKCNECFAEPWIPTDQQWFELNKGQADIHMMALAEAMWDALNESVPVQLKAGEWHMPYGDQINYAGQEYYEVAKKYIEDDTSADVLALKICTARCAQTSYTVVGEDGKAMNYEKLIGLHDRLQKAGHMSPFEHCARAMSEHEADRWVANKGRQRGWCGNFCGFIQYRKMIPGENITI